MAISSEEAAMQIPSQSPPPPMQDDGRMPPQEQREGPAEGEQRAAEYVDTDEHFKDLQKLLDESPGYAKHEIPQEGDDKPFALTEKKIKTSLTKFANSTSANNKKASGQIAEVMEALESLGVEDEIKAKLKTATELLNAEIIAPEVSLDNLHTKKVAKIDNVIGVLQDQYNSAVDTLPNQRLINYLLQTTEELQSMTAPALAAIFGPIISKFKDHGINTDAEKFADVGEWLKNAVKTYGGPTGAWDQYAKAVAEGSLEKAMGSNPQSDTSAASMHGSAGTSAGPQHPEDFIKDNVHNANSAEGIDIPSSRSDVIAKVIQMNNKRIQRTTR